MNNISAQLLSLGEARRLFFEGTEEACDIRPLYEELNGKELDKNAVLLAYQGTSEAMMADCVRGPFNKLDYFNRGKAKIESALSKEPGNMEIRYLRFQVQLHIPGILQYDNIDEDAAFLFDYLTRGNPGTQYDRDFINKIVETLLYSGPFNDREKRELKKIINQ